MKRFTCGIPCGMVAVICFPGCAAPHKAPRSTLPGIAIDHGTQILRVEGQVCIEEGILEYLAVAGGGKEYESLFALGCRPSHLHVAMLLAGYQEGEVAAELRGDFSPQADTSASTRPAGAPQVTAPPGKYFDSAKLDPTYVTIDVELAHHHGGRRTHPVEYFLIDRRTGKAPPRLTWAFTGSFFHRDEYSGLEFFVADSEKSVVALWYDPTALLNLAQVAGNPYRDVGAGFEINPDNLPQHGTAVRLILRPGPGPDS